MFRIKCWFLCLAKVDRMVMKMLELYGNKAINYLKVCMFLIIHVG